MSEGEVLRLVFFAIALIPSVVLHEVAHGWVANAFGDRTAKDAGRLSLNPIRHIDPFGTLLLPGLLIALNAAGIGGGMIFGYAKPVPVNAQKVGERPWRMILVAASGPLVNGVLAVSAALILRAVAPVSFRVVEFFLAWVVLNAVLLVFNLLPIPPLDGSKVVAWALPRPAREAFMKLDQVGFALVLLLIFAIPGGLSFAVDPLVEGLLRVVFR
jgi:Zn-dependent protease